MHIPGDSHFDLSAELGPASVPGEHVPFQEWDGNITRGCKFIDIDDFSFIPSVSIDCAVRIFSLNELER